MDKIQDAFEEMCQEIGVSTAKITVVDGGIATTGYQLEEVNEMLGVFCFAWKASRELQSVVCISEIMPNSYETNEYFDGWADCKEAIGDALDKAGIAFE